MRTGLFVLALAMSAGAVAEEPPLTFDRVTLQAVASAEVANDRMQAVLAAQQQDSDPARLADAVNRTMQWALERARKVRGVTAESGGYHTQPVYEKGGGLRLWRATQTVQLESTDFVRLSELVGRLQERLTVQSLSFSVSEASRRATEEQLIDEAISAFKARAARVQSNFGAGSWRLVELHINSGGMQPPTPVFRGAMAMAEAAAPIAVEGGSSELQVQVNGTIQLLPGSVIPPTN